MKMPNYYSSIYSIIFMIFEDIVAQLIFCRREGSRKYFRQL